MSRHNVEEHVEMSDRLRQIRRLLDPPTMVSPRAAADDAPGGLRPLLDVHPHQGRMYVAGHEPHFRAVTLLHRTHHEGAPAPS